MDDPKEFVKFEVFGCKVSAGGRYGITAFLIVSLVLAGSLMFYGPTAFSQIWH